MFAFAIESISSSFGSIVLELIESISTGEFGTEPCNKESSFFSRFDNGTFDNVAMNYTDNN